MKIIKRIGVLVLVMFVAFSPGGPIETSASPIITPALSWNTFLGGSGSDVPYSMAADGSGNTYVAGQSTATWGSPIRAFSGNVDAFVVKLDRNGTLLWNTFLGGTTDDFGVGLSVDSEGTLMSRAAPTRRGDTPQAFRREPGCFRRENRRERRAPMEYLPWRNEL